MTRLNQVAVNDSSQSHFNKISNHLLDEPSFFRVCTQINEFFLLQWWLLLAQIFCFDCVSKCCYATI